MMRVHLQMFAVRSHKERNGVLGKLAGRIRERFEAACHILDAEDRDPRLGELGVAIIGGNPDDCERTLDEIVTLIEADGSIVAGDTQIETYSMG